MRRRKWPPLKPWVTPALGLLAAASMGVSDLLAAGAVGLVAALLAALLAIVTCLVVVYQLPALWLKLRRIPDHSKIATLEEELGLASPKRDAVASGHDLIVSDGLMIGQATGGVGGAGGRSGARSGARPKGWGSLHPQPTCGWDWLPAWLDGHCWQTIHSTTRHGYQECVKCRRRRLDPRIEAICTRIGAVHQPIDQGWLEGGDWTPSPELRAKLDRLAQLKDQHDGRSSGQPSFQLPVPPLRPSPFAGDPRLSEIIEQTGHPERGL